VVRGRWLDAGTLDAMKGSVLLARNP